MASEVGVVTKEPNPQRRGVLRRLLELARRAQLVGVFGALVLVWSAVAVAQPSYHCRISGQISKSCCCAKKLGVRSETSVKPAGCCDLIEAVHASNVTVLPDDMRELVPTLVLATVVLGPDLPNSEETRDPSLQLPWLRPPGPAHFIANCSLLI